MSDIIANQKVVEEVQNRIIAKLLKEANLQESAAITNKQYSSKNEFSDFMPFYDFNEKKWYKIACVRYISLEERDELLAAHNGRVIDMKEASSSQSSSVNYQNSNPAASMNVGASENRTYVNTAASSSGYSRKMTSDDMIGGSVFVVIAIIIWVGGFIIGIVLGRNLLGDFSFGLALVYWFCAFIFGMIFMGINFILSNQKMLMDKMNDNGNK